jgi:two-component system cell cycle response regulator
LARVLVIDDSATVRAVVSKRIRAAGHEVDEVASGEAGAERALDTSPDVVVTDLVMGGLSGVQLCRVLRSDPATAHIPVILLTSSGDKRSRFWARSAGAAAYVGKDQIDELVQMLPALAASNASTRAGGWAAEPGTAPGAAATPRLDGEASQRSIHERVSAILDVALFDAVVAGEVRALAGSGTMPAFFEGLSTLLGDIVNYRALALFPSRAGASLYVHCHPAERPAVEVAARKALAVPAGCAAHVIENDGAVPGEGRRWEQWMVSFGDQSRGLLAIAPSSRGLSRDERRLLSLVAHEAGGPLEMISLYEDARRLATTDTLTGLLNRRAFLDALDRENLLSQRHTYPWSLLLLDADHFKRVNDTHGHAAGDAVLQGFARVLTKVARRSDIVGRWGGEEFVVALPHTGASGARIAAERVRRAIAEESFPIPGGEPLRMTASVGIATAVKSVAIDSIVGAADQAMYAAKARGRNRVELASPDTEGSSGQRPGGNGRSGS